MECILCEGLSSPRSLEKNEQLEHWTLVSLIRDTQGVE